MDIRLAGIITLLLVVMATANNPPMIRKDNTMERNQLAKEGEAIWLPCPVENEPSLIVEWEKDEESINRAWLRFKIKESGLRSGLRIKDVEVEDAGTYVCRATNGYGFDEISYRLYVKSNDSGATVGPEQQPPRNGYPNGPGEAPKFTRPDLMKVLEVRTIGKTIHFQCRASGTPEPQIRWYKDGMLFSSSHFGDDLKWTLRLSNLRNEDTGHYTCKVNNVYGEIEHTCMLEVVDPAYFEKYQPKVHIENAHLSVYAGDVIRLTAVIDSLPDLDLRVFWLKQVKSMVDFKGKKQNKTVEIEGQYFFILPITETFRVNGSYLNKLIIEHAQYTDEGKYVCLGVNTMGTSFKAAHLHVEPRSEFQAEQVNHSMALIIAVPVIIVIVVVFVVIYCACKKSQNTQKNGVKHPPAAPSKGRSGDVTKRPASSSSSATPAHSNHHYPQDNSKHYQGKYVSVPVHSTQPSHQSWVPSQGMYTAAMPQHHNHNNGSYVRNGAPGVHGYGGNHGNATYEYPLINGGNNSSSLYPSIPGSSSTQRQLDEESQGMILTDYGDISDGSVVDGPPRNPTPIMSQYSSADSSYVPPSVPQGYPYSQHNVA